MITFMLMIVRDLQRGYNRSMRIQVSEEWSLDLPEDLQERKEGDHLVFWKSGCTIIITAFACSGEKHRQVLLANLKARVEAENLESFADLDGQIERYAYMKKEAIMPGYTRLALHAFTTAAYGVLQTSFYLDNSDELRDCFLIWKSVEWHGEA